MSQSVKKVNLKDLFDKSSIPTLIVEGKWDLTWNIDKPKKLRSNHPNSRLIIFENSGHSPFEDEPKNFFNTLKEFIENIET